MNEKAQGFIDNHKKEITYGLCILLVIIVCSCGWLLHRHYTAAGESTGHDAEVTVQSAERDNQSARNDIGNAANQIESAQSDLDRAGADIDSASESVGQLQESVDSNQRTISECNNLLESSRSDIAEARGIFADIDRANQEDGTSR
jgi:peptidoglycan hydrolase CwlO-like protein